MEVKNVYLHASPTSLHYLLLTDLKSENSRLYKGSYQADNFEYVTYRGPVQSSLAWLRI
jgi:hypothetical protein